MRQRSPVWRRRVCRRSPRLSAASWRRPAGVRKRTEAELRRTQPKNWEGTRRATPPSNGESPVPAWKTQSEADESKSMCSKAWQRNLSTSCVAYMWMEFGALSRYLGGRRGGVPTDSCQDLQDVLNHWGRRSHHLQNVAQPWENFHPQQTLKHRREENLQI